jgi:hypothetical protein
MVPLFSMFGKLRQPKRKRNKTSKLARLTDITLATAIATNADVERQWLELKYGINIESGDDEISKLAAKLREQMTFEALEVLGEDAKSRETVIKGLIDTIKKNNAAMERSRSANDQGKYRTTEGNANRGQNPEKRKNLRKEMIKLIRDREKNARPAADSNSKQGTNQFSQIVQILAAAANSGTNSRIIAVEIDGSLVEMSPEAYQIYKKQREEIMAEREKLKDISQ